MRVTASAGIVFALGALVVGAGCAGSTEEAGQRTTTEAASAAMPGATEREPVPSIEGESLDGARLTLAGFRGKPVLINVWSSW